MARYLRITLAAGRVSPATSPLFISACMCQWFIKSVQQEEKLRACVVRDTRENRPFVYGHPTWVLLPQMAAIKPNPDFRSITLDDFKSSKYKSSDIRLIVVDIALIKTSIFIVYSSLIDYSLIFIIIISIILAT